MAPDGGHKGRLRVGLADGDYYRRGMVVRFDSPVSKLSTDDLLLISSRSDVHFFMCPTKIEGDRLYVECEIGALYRPEFWLSPHPSNKRVMILGMDDADVVRLESHYKHFLSPQS